MELWDKTMGAFFRRVNGDWTCPWPLPTVHVWLEASVEFLATFHKYQNTLTGDQKEWPNSKQTPMPSNSFDRFLLKKNKKAPLEIVLAVSLNQHMQEHKRQTAPGGELIQFHSPRTCERVIENPSSRRFEVNEFPVYGRRRDFVAQELLIALRTYSPV